MRYLACVLAIVVTACGSSTLPGRDLADAVITESKSDVSGCQFVARITAAVELHEFDGDRAAASEELFDRLRNSALHKGCDTVYLITVEDSMTQLKAVAEGYACASRGITDGPSGGTLP